LAPQTDAKESTDPKKQPDPKQKKTTVEQLKSVLPMISELVGPRSDLWAVGATMFTALTGQMVHEGQTDSEELLYAMTKRAPSVRTIAPDVSPDLAEVVDRALAFEQEARWPDARAMQTAVRAVAEKVRLRSLSKVADAVENTPSLALITGASTGPDAEHEIVRKPLASAK